MAARHLTLGREGEEAAARHLKKAGYKILERNWRAGPHELDIICRDKDKTLVFVEVKTRGPGPMAPPGQSVTREKQNRLVRAAGEYLSASDQWENPCRFDVVGVLATEHGLEVEHIKDAFQCSVSPGGGNAAWQPW